MEEVVLDGSQESSISNAVNELLSMTNAAVKKLTEPRSAGSESFSETSFQSVDPENDDKITAEEVEKDRRLLEILSETKDTTRDENIDAEENTKQAEPVDTSKVVGGKVIDVTNVLGESSKSEISILDVGGGQLDSSMSTPSSVHQHENESSSEAGTDGAPVRIPAPHMFKDPATRDIDVTSVLSPIVLETDAGHIEDEIEESFAMPVRKNEEKDNLTSSVISTSRDFHHATHISPTASEVLKHSTRAPRIPESARPKHLETTSTEEIQARPENSNQVESKRIDTTKPPGVIIRKSKHVEEDIERNAPGKDKFIPHQVRIPRSKIQEIQLPVTVSTADAKDDFSRNGKYKAESITPAKTTLSQGVMKTDEDKENEDTELNIDRDLKIIRSDIGATKKKLLASKKTGDQYRRIVPASIANEEAMQKRMMQGQTSDIMTIAMQHTAPMLKVQQNLESQVVRLTEQLNELERQKQKEETLKHQERSVDLERKLDELTALRLKSLEQLQEQQAAWQTQFLKVVGNMQTVQSQLNDATVERGNLPPRTVRFDGVKESYDVLRTPAPRLQAPYPTFSKDKVKGTSPGNGYLLKNILEQMDVSTPGPSPAVMQPTKLAKDPLVEVTPVRGPTGTSKSSLEGAAALMSNLSTSFMNQDDFH